MITVDVRVTATCDRCRATKERGTVDGSPRRLVSAVRRSLERRGGWQLAKPYGRLRRVLNRLLRRRPAQDLCPECRGGQPEPLVPPEAVDLTDLARVDTVVLARQ